MSISFIRRYLTEDATKQLVISCVLSRPYYCNSLLMSDTKSPKYCCTPHSQSTTPSKLHTSPTATALAPNLWKNQMCYNAITGSAPTYISELRTTPLQSFPRSTLFVRHMHAQTPTFQPQKPMTFAHFGPHIWNNLPLLLSLPLEANWSHFSFQNISVKQHCPSTLPIPNKPHGFCGR